MKVHEHFVVLFHRRCSLKGNFENICSSFLQKATLFRSFNGVVSYFVLFLAELAFCGEVFDLTFVLQYFRFIPEIEEIKFFLQVG